MSGQPYITSPSGRRIRIGTKKNGKLLRKHAPLYTVNFISRCEWATSSVPFVVVAEGESVTVPLDITMGADYTYVDAIGGTVSEAGVTIPSVTRNMTVAIIPSDKVPYTITVDSDCDWASTDASSYYGFDGHDAVIPVTYTDDADGTTIAVSEGSVVDGSIVLAVVHSDINVTISPSKVQVVPDLSNTENITAIVPSVAYGIPGGSVEFTVTYMEGCGPSDVNMEGGTFDDDTLTYNVPDDTWSVRPAITDASGEDIEIVIGTGTSNSDIIPTYTSYKYSITEQIFTAEEIGAVGKIRSLSFNLVNAANQDRNIDVYIAHTERYTFTNDNDWIAMTVADKVYSGVLDCHSSGWQTIQLDKPFKYNGDSNLVIMVDDNTGNYDGYETFAVTDIGNRMAIYRYGDAGNFSPETPSSVDGNYGRLRQRNYVKLLINGARNYEVTISSTQCQWATTEISRTRVAAGSSLSVPVILSDGADYSTISVTGGGTLINGSIVLTNVQADTHIVISPAKVQITPDITQTDRIVAITPSMMYATPRTITQFTVTYAEGYGDADVYLMGGSFNGNTLTYTVPSDSWIIHPAITNAGEDVEVTIGSGSDAVSYIPTYTYYYYSISEQLYLPTEIGHTGTIKSIAYNVTSATSSTRNLAIYMATTDRTSFIGNSDWIAMSESNKVFGGIVNTTTKGWKTIELSKPFYYDGTKNLVIMVDDNTGRNTDIARFAAFFNGNTYRTIYKYNNSTNYSPSNPTAGSGTSTAAGRNQIKLVIGPGEESAGDGYTYFKLDITANKGDSYL